jgi:Zn-dependent protease with chaperone function
MKNGLIVALAVLAVLVTAWMAKQGLDLSEGTEMSVDGYAAMIAGVVVSLAVGIVLMALVFFSSRRGYDEAAALDRQHGDDQDFR